MIFATSKASLFILLKEPSTVLSIGDIKSCFLFFDFVLFCFLELRKDSNKYKQ